MQRSAFPMWGFAFAAAITAQGATAVEPVTLWPEYQKRLLCPCEYVGYSFDGPWQELLEMKAAGGEICGTNSMWHPIEQEGVPYGCGVSTMPYKHEQVAQAFVADTPFDAVIVELPTESLTGSVTITLSKKEGEESKQIARRRFNDVPDLFRARLEFDKQPPGAYAILLSDPRGSIGVWVTGESAAAASAIFLSERLVEGLYLEFALQRPGSEPTWFATPERHHCVRMGPARKVDEVTNAALKNMMWVGNWNNGGFPYYPDWFYQRFPDVTMVDAERTPLMAGMFDTQKGWPSIDHPVIVNGTSRYIAQTVMRNADARGLVYWSLGGESLYPEYAMPCAGWPDYGENAQAHFRAWLERKYGALESLNDTWGTQLVSFSEASAPVDRESAGAFLDWMDYRFSAMAERAAWHYASVRTFDRDRLILTTNHGNPFLARSFCSLGADFPQYADVSDGFEMGQIIEGHDPGCFNLWYGAALAGLGKVGAPARLAYKSPDPKARGGARSYTPEAARRYAMEAFGSGWWHLGMIQWTGSLPDGEWGVKGTPAQQAIEEVFADLKRLRPLAEGAWPVLPKLAFYLSRPQWILEGWNPAWTDLHVWAIQHQYAHALLWEQQLLCGEAEPYAAVICPFNAIVAPAALDAFQTYVSRGGRLILLGDFAKRDPLGQRFDGQAAKLAQDPRVTWLKGSGSATFAKLPASLESAGVRPFCVVESRNTVSRLFAMEPLSGHHTVPIDLTPCRAVGQSFIAPKGVLRSVHLKTPTYTKQPSGFSVQITLHRDGFEGEVLAQETVPAESIADNAWTGLSVPEGMSFNGQETLYVQIRPDAEIPPLTLGVWSSPETPYPGGAAFLDGKPQEWHVEFQAEYTLERPVAEAVEAFALSDGSNFLVPLINLSDAAAEVSLSMDTSILTHPASRYSLFDAFTQEELGQRNAADLAIPAKGYRVVWVRCEANPEEVAASVAAAKKWFSQKEWPGFDLSYPEHLLKRANTAIEAGRVEKAAACVERTVYRTIFAACTWSLTGEDDLAVEMKCFLADGETPFEDAVGAARAVPLPNVTARFEQIAPGHYRAVIPARDIVTYDYAERRYEPYKGPLQLVCNLWRKRQHAQVIMPIR